MNPIGLTAAAIRLMALWLVVGVLIGLPGFVANWSSRVDFGDQARFMAASLRANLIAESATLAVAALLWFKSGTFARWMWQEPVTHEAAHVASAVDLERAVFVGVGVYLVVYGSPISLSSLLGTTRCQLVSRWNSTSADR
jgi:hypothetical protein